MPVASGERCGNDSVGFPYCSCNTGGKKTVGLGPLLGMGAASCDETDTQLWDNSLMCLLFCISREMGGNTSFTLSKVSMRRVGGLWFGLQLWVLGFSCCFALWRG